MTTWEDAKKCQHQAEAYLAAWEFLKFFVCLFCFKKPPVFPDVLLKTVEIITDNKISSDYSGKFFTNSKIKENRQNSFFSITAYLLFAIGNKISRFEGHTQTV